MKLQKVLIADGSDDFLLAVTQALQTQCQVLCCQDGTRALALLRQERCDLIILDLMLPGLDGITLLEMAISEGICPVIFAVTPLWNPYVEQISNRLRFGYLMRKPCDIQAVAARAMDLIATHTPPDRTQEDRRFVSKLLLDLGFSPKRDGYKYLLDAVPAYAANPAQAFTKELYPDIGKLHQHSGDSVERSIRSAMDAAWKAGDHGLWQQYFSTLTTRPPAAEFISRMAEILREQWE